MLGFDAEERLIQKLPQDFAAKVVWGSRYPHHDATSAWDALADLAREVVSRNPDLIVAIGPLITLAVSAATSTVPIVATGTHPMVSP
jgi:ABC-type uncharacterized transport system substrate-binding protein